MGDLVMLFVVRRLMLFVLVFVSMGISKNTRWRYAKRPELRSRNHTILVEPQRKAAPTVSAPT
jgi:hypothetical protein